MSQLDNPKSWATGADGLFVLLIRAQPASFTHTLCSSYDQAIELHLDPGQRKGCGGGPEEPQQGRGFTKDQ